VDSRAAGEGIRRRRECRECGYRFTTHERVERRLPLVVKKDGRREPFNREKVLEGLRLACRKRPVAARLQEEAAVQVEQAVLERGGDEVSSQEVGRVVLAALRSLDLVGYLRFASVYQEVQSPAEFLELLRPWLPGQERS
jgi:transcriptional repressor NrdR